ncbi:MAG TPA: efflux RND transporter periplasmic adaptor subunit [Burkholderiaceae bacterium]|nr:efflux RND transporter periplasmic adaptor subunit [Burkholderiaceae bacterium]
MNNGMKRGLKWGIAVLIIAALAFSVLKALKGRKEQQEAVSAAAAANAKAQAVVELNSTDTVVAQVNDIAQGLPISGSLKAANSAFIKARVAGELQGLTVREGDSVKAGQVIARVEATEYAARLQQAQDQADSAKAQIAIAQRQFDNNKALVDQGFISKTALDTSVANLNAAQATHRAALSNVDVAAKAVNDTVLRSPLSGIVSQRLAQPGERVAIEARIIEVLDMSRLELEANLSAADSLGVRVGQAATLQIEGINSTRNARVVRINPNAQAGSRSVLVYLGLDNASGLRQGLFAQGNVGTGKLTTLTVPLSAVRTDKPAPYVQVLENNAVKHVTVELGQRGEVSKNGISESVVAVKGIAPNTTLLAGSLGALRDGTVIKLKTVTDVKTQASTPNSNAQPSAPSAAAPAAPAAK